jgi:hypothetical protein
LACVEKPGQRGKTIVPEQIKNIERIRERLDAESEEGISITFSLLPRTIFSLTFCHVSAMKNKGEM